MNPDSPPAETIARHILFLRRQKVILDSELANLYGVPTKRLNEQIKRNINRFPVDFVFQLTESEFGDLRSQSATSSPAHGGRRTPPYAFTEHGAIMAATVLNTPRAIEMSVFVVRAFVQLREMLSTHSALAVRLEALERKIGGHDQAIAGLIDAVRQLMNPASPKRRNIGFIAEDSDNT